MLIDTHCHLNIMAKKTWDTPLTQEDLESIQIIVNQSSAQGIKKIINVGTSVEESLNCIRIAQRFPTVHAAIGIHPNDCTINWREDIETLNTALKKTAPGIIVAIGECGIDKHYSNYDLARQRDAFKSQIELALEHNLPLIIHTRDAGDETLACLASFKDEMLRGTIHCFSEDLSFAHDAFNLGFVIGIGAAITYPKNEQLRTVVKAVALEKIILETDAPFLPPQHMRGKQNSPVHIVDIARYIAELRQTTFEDIAQTTTQSAEKLFRLEK